jgi:hypothetical protein
VIFIFVEDPSIDGVLWCCWKTHWAIGGVGSAGLAAQSEQCPQPLFCSMLVHTFAYDGAVGAAAEQIALAITTTTNRNRTERSFLSWLVMRREYRERYSFHPEQKA